MKRKLFIVFIIFFLSFIIYNDLNKTHFNNYDQRKNIKVISFQTKKIKTKEGDTVISIIESMHQNKSIKRSNWQMIEDFKKLNPNVDPYKLKLNETYEFPLYKFEESLNKLPSS